MSDNKPDFNLNCIII